MQPNAPTIAILAPRLAPTVAWSTALYGVYTYLGAGLASYGLSPEQIAEVILAYGCGAIGGMLISGWAADRIRVKQAIELGLFGLSVCMLLIRLALDAGILIGFAFGLASMVAQIFFLAQQAALSEDFPTHRTTALAWNNSALFLGISLGSSVGGQAILLGGFEANLTISAAIALVGWGISKAIGSGSTWLRPRTAAKRGLAATATKPRPDASVT
jgi:predicted MFS family arabinose efflux permease